MKVSYGSPFLTEEQQRQRRQGLLDAYLTSIMSLPLATMERVAPGAGYTPGELRSNLRDKLRAERFAWEEHLAGRRQEPEYAKGAQLGEMASYVADPLLDLPGLAAARLASLGRRTLRAEDVGRVARGILAEQRGAIERYGDDDILSSFVESDKIDNMETEAISEAIERIKKRAEELAEEYEHVGIRTAEGPPVGKYARSYVWEEGEPTDVMLEGISATSVLDPSWIAQHITRDKPSLGYYPGERTMLIGSNRLHEYGEDVGEVVIDPEYIEEVFRHEP